MSDKVYTAWQRIAALLDAHPEASIADLAQMAGCSRGAIRAALRETTTPRRALVIGGAR